MWAEVRVKLPRTLKAVVNRIQGRSQIGSDMIGISDSEPWTLPGTCAVHPGFVFYQYPHIHGSKLFRSCAVRSVGRCLGNVFTWAQRRLGII